MFMGLSGEQLLAAFSDHTDKLVAGLKGMRPEEKAQPPKKVGPIFRARVK